MTARRRNGLAFMQTSVVTSANRVCGICGLLFYYPPGSNHAGKYCSRACMSKAFSNRQIRKCVTCGQAIERKPSHIKSSTFCSRDCYYASMRGRTRKTAIVIPCARCEKDMSVNPAWKTYRPKFCSRKCQLDSQRDGATTPELERLRKSARYQEWRTTVFERDNYTCVKCGDGNYKGRGRTVELHADHIKAFAHYSELRFDVDNGQTLCAPCHRGTENFGVKAWRGRARVDV